MTGQRGTALLEIVIIGFAVVVLVLPVISTVARLSEANAVVHAAARDGAAWVARHGGSPPQAEGVELTIVEDRESVEVTATQNVTLIGVGGASMTRVVRSSVEVAVSAYRSSP